MSMVKVHVLKSYGSFFGLIGICIVLGILSVRFLTLSNLTNVARQVSINAILASGMTLVIITGGIDLSVGSLVAFTGCSALLAMDLPGSDTISLITGLLAGAAAGCLSGILVSIGRVPPFIATLSMLIMARGAALAMTSGQPIVQSSGLYLIFGQGFLGPVPVPICIMGLVLLACHFILSNTPMGSSIYAIGGNEEAARLSGIKIGWTKVSVYVVSGLCSAIAGIVLAARLASAQPNTGVGFELDAIAAVVLGGTSLMGGKGGIVGTLIGAFIIGVLNNGFNLLNVSPYYQLIAKGAIIIFAVLVDQILKR
jgi:ribose/xylose/arabinose/galactoside ABC-type transport system permease subunit